MSTAITRRKFIKMTTALSATVVWPEWMPRLAFAPPQTAPRGDVLICIFLRGAADGLSMVVPHGDEHYYRQRPSLAIPRPDDISTMPRSRTLDLDGFFGLFVDNLVQLLAIVGLCGWQCGMSGADSFYIFHTLMTFLITFGQKAGATFHRMVYHN